MLLGEIHHEGLPLPRDEQHMHPDKIVEDPPCRGILHPLAFLVGKRRMLLFERPTEAGLSSRIDEETDGHDHQ